MSLEGLLALVGIILAIYALAQPVQRRSALLFVPIWLVVFSIIISAGLIVWRFAVPIFCYRFYPWSDFASMVIAFFLPVISSIIAVVAWHRAKLGEKKNKKFRDFILTCSAEDRYDELLRILGINKAFAASVLEAETLDLLFERKFVEYSIRSRNWIHLYLSSDGELLIKLTDKLAAINNLMRELVMSRTSPLHSAIVAAYGGREHARPTKEEWELITKTLQDPEWYMNVRADYPLIIYAYETIASNKLDVSYNQKDDLYVARQGESTRLGCPIYLALKTHVLMLKKAIEAGGINDYYVSDLWDLFRNTLEHSKYYSDAWESRDANQEYPTPFAFLLKEILFDLKDLCEENYKQGRRPPGRIGEDLFRTWATCVSDLGFNENHVSDRFVHECIGDYLAYVLEMEGAYESAGEDNKEKIKQWRDGLVTELKRHRAGGNRFQSVLFSSINDLDYGKRHIGDYHAWLRGELNLPDWPGPEHGT